ncbi:hypothetical protein NK216_03690, partial [Aeromonas hydrophila]|uniref:hypothetical protein n=1 Tax=Aeromonas hydrophila TaxID=644 RepID=UPI0020A1210B
MKKNKSGKDKVYGDLVIKSEFADYIIWHELINKAKESQRKSKKVKESQRKSKKVKESQRKSK